jgi:hypothetical protein
VCSRLVLYCCGIVYWYYANALLLLPLLLLPLLLPPSPSPPLLPLCCLSRRTSRGRTQHGRLSPASRCQATAHSSCSRTLVTSTSRFLSHPRHCPPPLPTAVTMLYLVLLPMGSTRRSPSSRRGAATVRLPTAPVVLEKVQAQVQRSSWPTSRQMTASDRALPTTTAALSRCSSAVFQPVRPASALRRSTRRVRIRSSCGSQRWRA